MNTTRSPFACLRLSLAGLVLCAAGLVHAEDVYRVDYLGRWTIPTGGGASLRYIADLEGNDAFYYTTTSRIYQLNFANLGSTPTLSRTVSQVSSSSLSAYGDDELLYLDLLSGNNAIFYPPTGGSAYAAGFIPSPGQISSLYWIKADYTQTASTLNLATKSLLYLSGASNPTIYYSNFNGTGYDTPVAVYSSTGVGKQVWLSDDGATIYLWSPSPTAGPDNLLESLKLVNGVWTLQANPVQVAPRSINSFTMASDGTFFLWTGTGAGARYAADGALLASFAAPNPGTGTSPHHNINYNSDTGKLVLSDGSGIYAFQAVAPVPVTSFADSGTGTLRQAINEVVTEYRHSENAKFSALFDTPQTINLESSLDALDGSSGPFAIEAQSTLTVNSGTHSFLNVSGSGLVYSVANVVSQSTSANAIKVSNSAILKASNFNFDNMTLDGGIFRTSGTLVSAGNVFLGIGGGTFDVTSGTTTLAGVISGDAVATKTGAGQLTLSGSNSHSGGTQINGGVLSIASRHALGTGGLGLNGGTLRTTSDIILTRDVTLGAGGGTFDSSGGYFTVNGNFTGTGGLTKSGGNILTLSGAHTYTGPTSVLAGTMKVADNGATASAFASSSVAISSGARMIFANSQTYAGAITGAGLLEHEFSGTTTFTGTASHTGGTGIVGGEIQLGNGGTIGSLAGNVALSNGGLLAFNRSDAVTFSGTISGAGGVTQRGGGRTILTAAHTYTGNTLISDGEFIVNGSIAGDALVQNGGLLGGRGTIGGAVTVQSGGTLSPGNSPDQITLEDNLTLESGSFLLMEFSGTGAAEYDRLDVQGIFIAGGTLNLMLIDGFTPAEGMSFTIFNGLTPGFDGGAFNIATNLGGGLSWNTDDLASGGVVSVVPEPGTVALVGLGLAAILFRRRIAPKT